MEELDLKELLSMFWIKKIEILLITLIFMVIGIIYSYAFVTPEYKSSTTLLLATVSDSKQQSNSDTAITQTDITLNSSLISTYSELIKRKTVLREVIDNLDVKELNEGELRKDITVSAVSDTELIEISVVDKNAENASKIANEIANVFTRKVAEYYKINNVHVIDKAEIEQNPYNVNHLKDILIFVFIGIVIAIAKILITNMLDNTVKTEQDVEKATGLLVLAQIPEFEMAVRRGGRRK